MYKHIGCNRNSGIGLTAKAIVNLTTTSYDKAKFWLEEPEGMSEDLVEVIGIYCYECNETIKEIEPVDLETFESEMSIGAHNDVLTWDAD